MLERHPFPDEFAVPGSSIYYALRFAPRKQRPKLALVNAFTRSLLNIPRECSDPGVAGTKLRWWREELERARQGETQHPLIDRMASLCRQQTVPDDHFTCLFQGIERELRSTVMKNQAQLDSHCRSRGALFTRLLTLTAQGTDDEQRWAEQLGQFVCVAEIIRDLGGDLRRNRCLLPVDALKERGLAPANLLADEQQPPLTGLLAEIATIHRGRYRETLAGLPTGPKPALGTALSLAAMADALLQEIAKEGYQVLHRRTSLTPLHKLWIARRSHSKARSPRG